ncbi:MAG: hypothetical protein OEW68_13100 [Gammaproteobacteria bacterium]|nr:hypothetical protein [Gammaproteobacteria bacterium]MDH4315771.1 hypothetical protein [Gammaproteobacteria bacterium]MDH5215079.1 hypothetical protein [Gammaproteobacteria bacterium]MDH5501615.1 hypothetical protein [Gammaproteobacteria bacterium]
MRNLIIWAVLLGGIAYGGAKLYLHHKVGSGMDSAVMMMSPYAEVSYKGVSSTISGKLTINGLRARINGFSDELYVERLGIDTPSFLTLMELGDMAGGMRSSGGEIPEYFGIIVEGMKVPVKADYYQKVYDLGLGVLGAADANEPAAQCVGKYGFSPAALSDLGYDEQNLSFAVYLRQSASAFTMNMTASVEQMWTIDADLAFAGDMRSEMSKGAGFRPKMSRMEFVLTDHSLNERVNEYCEQLGLSQEETLRAQLDALHFFGENNGIVFDEYIIGPYTEYLSGKPTLLVTAQPSEPLNLAQIGLYKPSDVPALLNLSAVAQ